MRVITKSKPKKRKLSTRLKYRAPRRKVWKRKQRLKRIKTLRFRVKLWKRTERMLPQRTRTLSAIFKIRAQKVYVAKLLRLRRLKRNKLELRRVKTLSLYKRTSQMFEALTLKKEKTIVSECKRAQAARVLIHRQAEIRRHTSSKWSRDFSVRLRAPLSRRANKKLQRRLKRRTTFKGATIRLRTRLRRMKRRTRDAGQRAYHSRSYNLTDRRARRVKRLSRTRLYQKAWSRLLRTGAVRTEYNFTRRVTSRPARQLTTRTQTPTLMTWFGIARARLQLKKLIRGCFQFFSPSRVTASQATKRVDVIEADKLQTHYARLKVNYLGAPQPGIVLITKRQRQRLALRARLKKKVSKRQQRRLLLAPTRVVVKKPTLGLGTRVSVKRTPTPFPVRTPADVRARVAYAAKTRYLLTQQPRLAATSMASPVTYYPGQPLPKLIATLERYVARLIRYGVSYRVAAVRKTIEELKRALWYGTASPLNVPTWVDYHTTPRNVRLLFLPEPKSRPKTATPARFAKLRGTKHKTRVTNYTLRALRARFAKLRGTKHRARAMNYKLRALRVWRANQWRTRQNGVYEASQAKESAEQRRLYNGLLKHYELWPHSSTPVFADVATRSLAKRVANLKKKYLANTYTASKLSSTALPRRVNKRTPSYLTLREDDIRALLVTDMATTKHLPAKLPEQEPLPAPDTLDKKRAAVRLRTDSLYLRRARRAPRLVLKLRTWRYIPVHILRKNNRLLRRRRDERARAILLRTRKSHRTKIYRRGLSLRAVTPSRRKKTKIKTIRRYLRVRQKLSLASRTRILLHHRHFRRYFYLRYPARRKLDSISDKHPHRYAYKLRLFLKRPRKARKKYARKLSTGRRKAQRRFSKPAPRAPRDKRRDKGRKVALRNRLKREKTAFKKELRARCISSIQTYTSKKKVLRSVRIPKSMAKRRANTKRVRAKKIKLFRKMLRSVPRNRPFRSTAGPKVFTLLSALHALAAFTKLTPQFTNSKAQTLLSLQPSTICSNRPPLNISARYLAHRQLVKHRTTRQAGVRNLLIGLAGLRCRGHKLRPYRGVRQSLAGHNTLSLENSPAWSHRFSRFVARRSAAKLLPLKDRLQQFYRWKLEITRSPKNQSPEPSLFQYRPSKRQYITQSYSSPRRRRESPRQYLRRVRAEREDNALAIIDQTAETAAAVIQRRRAPVLIRRKNETAHNFRRRNARVKHRQKIKGRTKKKRREPVAPALTTYYQRLMRLKRARRAYRSALLNPRQKLRLPLLFRRLCLAKKSLHTTTALRAVKKGRTALPTVIKQLINRKIKRFRLRAAKVLYAGRRIRRGVSHSRFHRRRKVRGPVRVLQQWRAKIRRRLRRRLNRRTRNVQKIFHLNRRKDRLRRIVAGAGVRNVKRESPYRHRFLPDTKKTLFVSTDPVTPLLSNKELVYTSVDPVDDSVGFIAGASAETRDRLWKAIIEYRHRKLASEGTTTNFNKLPTKKQKKSSSARSSRYAKKQVFRRVGAALTYAQRAATKLELGRLLTLKQLLRTNQFGRLEQLGALTDLGDHSPLGSLQQLSSLGLLTKDLKQTLLLKLAAGIRVAARCCSDSSGRRLLRQYAVVTRTQERVLFTRKEAASAAEGDSEALLNPAPVKSNLADLEALYNLQRGDNLSHVNTDLILTEAKHSGQVHAKWYRSTLEDSFDDFDAPVLSDTARTELEEEHQKQATKYNKLIRTNRRPLKLRGVITDMADDLQMSKDAVSGIELIHRRLRNQQRYARARVYPAARTTTQKYPLGASTRTLTKRTPTTQTGRRYTPYKGATALSGLTTQAPVTDFYAPKYSLPLSSISSNYTQTVRPVSTQQLWTSHLGAWVPVDGSQSSAPALRKSFSTPQPWAQKVILPAPSMEDIDLDLEALSDGFVAPKAAAILAAALKKPLIRVAITRYKAKAIYFPQSLPENRFWHTEAPKITLLPRAKRSQPKVKRRSMREVRVRLRTRPLLLGSTDVAIEEYTKLQAEKAEDWAKQNPRQAKSLARAEAVARAKAEAVARVLAAIKAKATATKKKDRKIRQAQEKEDKRAAWEKNKRVSKSEYNRELGVTVYDSVVFKNINSYGNLPEDQRQTAEGYDFLLRAYKAVLSTPERKDLDPHNQSAQRQVVVRLLEKAGCPSFPEGGTPMTWKEVAKKIPVVRSTTPRVTKNKPSQAAIPTQPSKLVSTKFVKPLEKFLAKPENERATKDAIGLIRQVINGTWTTILDSEVLPAETSPFYADLVYAAGLFTEATGVTLDLTSKPATTAALNKFKDYKTR